MEGRNIVFPQADKDASAHGDVPRRPGAQPGNLNRYVHGRYAKGYKDRQKRARAQLKVLCHVAHLTGAFTERNRTRPVRPHEVAQLVRHDPALLSLAEYVEVPRVSFFRPLMEEMLRAPQGAHPETKTPQTSL